MKIQTSVFAALLALAPAAALAQWGEPAPGDTELPGGGASPTPTGEAPGGFQQPSAPRAPVAGRPQGQSFGVGIGWNFPLVETETIAEDPDTGERTLTRTQSSLFTPNTVAARFRLDDGLTFEPNVTLAIGSGSQKVDADAGTAENKLSLLAIGLGAQARYPIASRGPVDFLALAGLGITYTSVGFEPEADGPLIKTPSAATTFNVLWGLGVEWWIEEYLSLSADASNPFLVLTSNSHEQEVPEADPTVTSESTFQLGAIFNPVVRVMLFLHY